MAQARTLTGIIGRAIRDADRSIFNEDYNKQAQAVLKELKNQGYEIVPLEPSEQLVAYAEQNMPTGRMAPAQFLRELYKVMVGNAARLR